MLITTEYAGRELYHREIYPKLKQIFEDIIYRKIKTKDQLKSAFYKAIDIVSNNIPQVSYYLKAWGSDL